MTYVEKISFEGGLEIELKDNPIVSYRCLSLDKNGDSVFNVADVDLNDPMYKPTGITGFLLNTGLLRPEQVRQAKFDDAVLDVLEEARVTTTIDQRIGMQKFFDVYPKVKALASALAVWRDAYVIDSGTCWTHTNWIRGKAVSCKEWLIDAGMFGLISRAIARGESPLSNRFEHGDQSAGDSLTEDIIMAAIGLSGGELDDHVQREVEFTGEYRATFESKKLNPLIKGPFLDMLAMYTFAGISGPDQLECAGAACEDLDRDEINIRFTPVVPAAAD